MKRWIIWISSLAALAGCTQKSGVGFRLPDGDADRGRAAFVALHCHGCHVVEGLDVPYMGTGGASIELGGRTTHVKTYGELVTSIVNPSHRIAPRHREEGLFAEDTSLMQIAFLNDVMTVQQLIDLVAYLQSTYEVVPPPIDPYTYRYP